MKFSNKKHISKAILTLLFIQIIQNGFAQSVLITPSKSRVSDTLVVKKNLGIGVDSLSEKENRFEVKANENASFFIHDWNLDGENALIGRFYSPNGKFPQLRFESEGNGFFDTGMSENHGFAIEFDDDPKFWISTGNTVNIKNRLVFSGSGGSIFIGENSGQNSELTNNYFNTFIGNGAGKDNTTGFANVYIGSNAGGNNIVGNSNIAIGEAALYNNLSEANTAIGKFAMKESGSSTANTAIGNYAGFASNGNSNFFLGTAAGESAVGNGNVFIGNEVGTGSAVSNKLFIDNSNTNEPLIEGSFSGNSLKINGKLSSSNNLGVKTDEPLSTLDVNGSMALKAKSNLESGVDEPDDTAGIWIFTTKTGDITLPSPASCPNRIYTIVNKTASNINISAFKDMLNASQTTIASATSILIVSDGTDWQQIK